jgi:fructoselysine-6-P-deglycase FrlB-like protein
VALKQARVAVNGYGVVGPAALIERRVPLMVFARSRQMLANSLEVLSWLREQGAHCLVVSVPK